MTDNSHPFLEPVEMRSRAAFRTHRATQAALEHHTKKGYDLTHQDTDLRLEMERMLPAFSTWRVVPIDDVYEGERLPDQKGLYGFFNLSGAASPIARVLYIGKSARSLKTRVTRSHQKFYYAARHGATHVIYRAALSSMPDEALAHFEVFAIQKWAPYLNRAENIFNYEVEPLLF